MPEEEKEKHSIFGPHPFSSGRSKNGSRPKWTPFGKTLTAAEKNAKRLKKQQKKEALESVIQKGNYDRVTVLIAKIILEFAGLGLAKMYVKSCRLFNFMLVGATGTIFGWFLFNLYRALLPWEFVAYIFTVLTTFVWNYIWNERWTFRYKNIEKPDEESEESE